MSKSKKKARFKVGDRVSVTLHGVIEQTPLYRDASIDDDGYKYHYLVRFKKHGLGLPVAKKELTREQRPRRRKQ